MAVGVGVGVEVEVARGGGPERPLHEPKRRGGTAPPHHSIKQDLVFCW
jgi:hypothetical protein